MTSKRALPDPVRLFLEPSTRDAPNCPKEGGRRAQRAPMHTARGESCLRCDDGDHGADDSAGNRAYAAHRWTAAGIARRRGGPAAWRARRAGRGLSAGVPSVVGALVILLLS